MRRRGRRTLNGKQKRISFIFILSVGIRYFWKWDIIRILICLPRLISLVSCNEWMNIIPFKYSTSLSLRVLSIVLRWVFRATRVMRDLFHIVCLNIIIPKSWSLSGGGWWVVEWRATWGEWSRGSGDPDRIISIYRDIEMLIRGFGQRFVCLGHIFIHELLVWPW